MLELFEMELFIWIKMDLTYNGWCAIKSNQSKLKERFIFTSEIFQITWQPGYGKLADYVTTT